MTVFINRTDIPPVSSDERLICYRKMDACVATEKKGCVDGKYASYRTAVLVSPVFLLLLDWFVGNPGKYIIGRCLGTIKRPTAPLLRLSGVKTRTLRDPYMRIGKGRLYAHETPRDRVYEFIKHAIFVGA